MCSCILDPVFQMVFCHWGRKAETFYGHKEKEMWQLSEVT